MKEAIGLDTNVLARYYVSDDADGATARQSQIARAMMESGQSLMVCKSVLLELEWVLRGYYGFSAAEIGQVLTHLLGQSHIQIEGRDAVERAVQSHAAGLDFADALHHASYADCASMVSFDDRRFARRSRRLGLIPNVRVPT